MANDNRDRLLRAIRALQLVQRNNLPKSTISKAVEKALAPLLAEMENHPEPVAVKPPAKQTLKGLHEDARARQGMGDAYGPDNEPS